MCIRDSSCPLIFCASDRWCRSKVVVSPAYIERESVTWYYDEGYFERERYGDRKIELFEVGRNYKELIEKINNERVDYIKGLPCEVISTAVVDKNDDNKDNKHLPYGLTGVVVDNYDGDNNDFITYLVGTDDTKGDRTILNRDKLYEIMIWSDHIDYNSIVKNYKKLNNRYIENHNIRYSIKNDLYRPKIGWLFDDGG